MPENKLLNHTCELAIKYAFLKHDFGTFFESDYELTTHSAETETAAKHFIDAINRKLPGTNVFNKQICTLAVYEACIDTLRNIANNELFPPIWHDINLSGYCTGLNVYPKPQQQVLNDLSNVINAISDEIYPTLQKRLCR